MRKEIKKLPTSDEVETLSNFMEQTSLQLLVANGTDLIQQIGVDVIRGIILDILVGKNLRDSTEKLTRRRIASLNLAMASLFVKYPMAEARGFYRDCSLLASSRPLFVATTPSGLWALDSVYRLAHKQVVRYCFYPGERFTLERPNSIRLSVCEEL